MVEPHKPVPKEDDARPAEPLPALSTEQRERILKGLDDADHGRIASKEAVRAVIQKFVPNG